MNTQITNLLICQLVKQAEFRGNTGAFQGRRGKRGWGSGAEKLRCAVGAGALDVEDVCPHLGSQGSTSTLMPPEIATPSRNSIAQIELAESEFGKLGKLARETQTVPVASLRYGTESLETASKGPFSTHLRQFSCVHLTTIL